MSASEHRSAAWPIVREAERIVYREKWRIREEEAAERLAATRDLASIRLFPESPVIRIVALDGRVVGRVRRERNRWVAVCRGRVVAATDTLAEAVYAFADLEGHPL
ncbi:hypothetical protein [Amycolatopsis silviterrae]|uniref:Uncharacterized protein n=1 Tax=Amycolatopsis silviterrae TaxID=1656914 RepID=A0ABW5HNC8_9PSEU